MKSGSARNGRAMLTMSEVSSCNSASAVDGSFIRFVDTNGMDTTLDSFNALVQKPKVALGTDVAMVGTRASCQPTTNNDG